MKVIVGANPPIELGTTEVTPTVGITDYSRRVTDDFGVTKVVERGFARRLSARLAVPFEQVDGLQRTLAGLRATSAQWVADDDLAWLKPTGFYKDFEVDLAVPPLSFCTLTIEGLAESASIVDGGGDPAPEAATSTLRMLRPLAVTDALLASSSVPENDAPVWSAGVTYGVGGRVIRTGVHRVFESLTAGNIGHVPESSPGQWLDVGPTNRWAMFDETLGTVTSAAGGSIAVTFPAGAISAVAALDLVGSALRVEVIPAGETLPSYDQSEPVNGGTLSFFDLPTIAGTVRVTLTGAGTVSIGTLLVGEVLGIGITEASPTAGITDFSRKQVDEFGAVTIVERAWAKRMTARSLIRTDALDVTADRIASVRARPVLWIGETDLDTLTVYGFFRDFSIEVGDTLSKLSLSIEGLSRAETLTLPWAADIARLQGDIDRIGSDGFLNAGEKPQAIIDWNAAVANLAALDERYGELGSPGDITPSRDAATTKVLALTAYLNGLAPAWTDTGQDTPIVAATYQQRWTEAYEALANFSAAITGRPGEAGGAGGTTAFVQAYRRSATTPALPTATSTFTFASGILAGLSNGWSASIPAANGQPLWVIAAVASGTGASDTIAAGEWSAPVIQANDGASAFTLVNIANCDFPTPTTVRKASGANGNWDARARTAENYINGATVSAAFGTAGAVFGLTTDPTASVSWETIDYGLYASPDGTTYVMRNGTQVPLGGNQPGLYRVESDGKTIRYFRDATPIHSHAANEASEVLYGVFAVSLDGATITNIAFGSVGAPGLNGLSTAAVRLFQRAASAPPTPSTTSTYTFASGAVTGFNNGWSATIPAHDGNPLWETLAAAIAPADQATDTIAAGEWIAPQKTAENGTNGLPGVSTFQPMIYQRSASGAPALPSSVTTFTFSTRSLSGLDNGWSTIVPGGSAPLYVSTAIASSTTDTDTIQPNEWATAQIFAPPGADGSQGLTSAAVTLYQRNNTGVAPPAPSVTTTWTFATSSLSGANNGWTQAAPDAAAGKFLFWTQAAALGIGTDTIAAGEWAAPILYVKDGEKGDIGDQGPAGFTLSGGGSASVAATSGGTPKTGELPKTFTMKVMQGTTDRSDEGATTYAITASTGCTASLGGTNGKVLSVTAMTADTASVTVTVYRSGVAIGTQEVKLSKARDGGSATSGRDDTLNAMPNSGTDALLGSFALLVGDGAQLKISGSAQWQAGSGGSQTYGGQIRASYTVDGTETYGNYYSGDIVANQFEPAFASFSADPIYTNSSGAVKTVTIRLYGRRSVGTAASFNTSGVVEASAS